MTQQERLHAHTIALLVIDDQRNHANLWREPETTRERALQHSLHTLQAVLTGDMELLASLAAVEDGSGNEH